MAGADDKAGAAVSDAAHDRRKPRLLGDGKTAGLKIDEDTEEASSRPPATSPPLPSTRIRCVRGPHRRRPSGRRRDDRDRQVTSHRATAPSFGTGQTPRLLPRARRLRFSHRPSDWRSAEPRQLISPSPSRAQVSTPVCSRLARFAWAVLAYNVAVIRLGGIRPRDRFGRRLRSALAALQWRDHAARGRGSRPSSSSHTG